MDKRTIIPMLLMLGALFLPFAGSDAVSSHLGGEGHGEGIDVVYSSMDDCIATVTLKQLPSGDVTLTFISLTDGQSVGPIESAKVINVFLQPLVYENYTVLVTLHETGAVIAECELIMKEVVGVRYSPGEGSGYMAPTETVPGGSVTLSACTFTAPEGRTFLYWEIDGTSYQPGTSMTLTGDLTAKAVWGDRVCTVTFEANGGKGTMNPMNVEYGVTIKLPECAFQPSGDASFSNWEIDGQKYAAGDSYTVKGDTAVRAIWSEPNDMTMILVGAAAILLIAIIGILILIRRR